MGRLQEYLGPRLEHREGVWVLDGSDFPKQGVKSVGVATQYCGRLGKVANCQAGMFLAYVSPLGRALVGKRLYLPVGWTSDDERCQAAGVPEEKRSYRSKTELALEMVEQALAWGHLRAGWVAGDDAFGMSPSFREGLLVLGMGYVLDIPANFTVWLEEPEWTSPAYQGKGRPPQTQAAERTAADHGGAGGCHSGGSVASDHSVKSVSKTDHCGVVGQGKCPGKCSAKMSLRYAAMVSDVDGLGTIRCFHPGGPPASR